MATKKTGGTKAAKATPKKGTKGKGKRVLATAKGEQCFWTTDGSILANLVELRDALKTMSADVFAHHVNKQKNDFADWIEHVLGDRELAVEFRKSKKSNTARTVVVSRLRIYDI